MLNTEMQENRGPFLHLACQGAARTPAPHQLCHLAISMFPKQCDKPTAQRTY